MLLDTGADETCFPNAFAGLFGHDNGHPHVERIKNSYQGIGGLSDAFLHSVRISLIDPVKSSTKRQVLAWSSGADKLPFVEKLDCSMGLLGMDIMRNWKSLSFRPIKSGLLINIEI